MQAISILVAAEQFCVCVCVCVCHRHNNWWHNSASPTNTDTNGNMSHCDGL